jgi:MtN3 and saliva related transmembrane protein
MEAIGFIGAAISISSGIPQIIKCFRTRNAGDLSYTSFAVAYLGSCISMYYGISIEHEAILLSSLYAIIINSLLTGTKYYLERETLTKTEVVSI